jgi:hypothetical protein
MGWSDEVHEHLGSLSLPNESLSSADPGFGPVFLVGAALVHSIMSRRGNYSAINVDAAVLTRGIRSAALRRPGTLDLIAKWSSLQALTSGASRCLTRHAHEPSCWSCVLLSVLAHRDASGRAGFAVADGASQSWRWIRTQMRKSRRRRRGECHRAADPFPSLLSPCIVDCVHRGALCSNTIPSAAILLGRLVFGLCAALEPGASLEQALRSGQSAVALRPSDSVGAGLSIPVDARRGALPGAGTTTKVGGRASQSLSRVGLNPLPRPA